jgi:hypothetical protein
MSLRIMVERLRPVPGIFRASVTFSHYYDIENHGLSTIFLKETRGI